MPSGTPNMSSNFSSSRPGLSSSPASPRQASTIGGKPSAAPASGLNSGKSSTPASRPASPGPTGARGPLGGDGRAKSPGLGSALAAAARPAPSPGLYGRDYNAREGKPINSNVSPASHGWASTGPSKLAAHVAQGIRPDKAPQVFSKTKATPSQYDTLARSNIYKSAIRAPETIISGIQKSLHHVPSVAEQQMRQALATSYGGLYNVPQKTVLGSLAIESGLGRHLASHLGLKYTGALQVGPEAFADAATAESKKLGIKNEIANIQAGVAYLSQNAKRFESKYGRPPTTEESYAMHQQGFGGFNKLARNPMQPAHQVLGSVKRVSQNLPKSLRDKAKTMTAGEFLSTIGAYPGQKFSKLTKTDLALADVNKPTTTMVQAPTKPTQVTENTKTPTPAPRPAPAQTAPKLPAPPTFTPAPPQQRIDPNKPTVPTLMSPPDKFTPKEPMAPGLDVEQVMKEKGLTKVTRNFFTDGAMKKAGIPDNVDSVYVTKDGRVGISATSGSLRGLDNLKDSISNITVEGPKIADNVVRPEFPGRLPAAAPKPAPTKIADNYARPEVPGRFPAAKPAAPAPKMGLVDPNFARPEVPGSFPARRPLSGPWGMPTSIADRPAVRQPSGPWGMPTSIADRPVRQPSGPWGMPTSIADRPALSAPPKVAAFDEPRRDLGLPQVNDAIADKAEAAKNIAIRHAAIERLHVLKEKISKQPTRRTIAATEETLGDPTVIHNLGNVKPATEQGFLQRVVSDLRRNNGDGKKSAGMILDIIARNEEVSALDPNADVLALLQQLSGPVDFRV